MEVSYRFIAKTICAEVYKISEVREDSVSEIKAGSVVGHFLNAPAKGDQNETTINGVSDYDAKL